MSCVFGGMLTLCLPQMPHATLKGGDRRGMYVCVCVCVGEGGWRAVGEGRMWHCGLLKHIPALGAAKDVLGTFCVIQRLLVLCVPSCT